MPLQEENKKTIFRCMKYQVFFCEQKKDEKAFVHCDCNNINAGLRARGLKKKEDLSCSPPVTSRKAGRESTAHIPWRGTLRRGDRWDRVRIVKRSADYSMHDRKKHNLQYDQGAEIDSWFSLPRCFGWYLILYNHRLWLLSAPVLPSASCLCLCLCLKS